MIQSNSILLPKDIDFSLSSTLPTAYNGFVLRGASVFAASADAGNIIIQTFEQPLYTIRYIFFELFRPLTVTFSHGHTQLDSFLSLKSTIHYTLKGLGTLTLKQGQYALLQQHSKDFKAHYEPGNKHQALHVSWAPEIINEAVDFFPILAELQKNNVAENTFLIPPPQQARSASLFVANQMLESKLSENQMTLYFQNKVREYLLFLLADIIRQPAKPLAMTEHEWQIIDGIAESLRREPDKKFPIEHLAQQAGMNTMKLKVAFKQRYGKGIFEYQLDGRLQEALRLLQETNLPVKEISSMVGYKLSTSFITKFREYFGFYVTDVVRKSK